MILLHRIMFIGCAIIALSQGALNESRKDMLNQFLVERLVSLSLKQLMNEPIRG